MTDEVPIERPSELNTEAEEAYLSSTQAARVRAAEAARLSLYSTGFASTAGPDVGDVIRLAEWIMTGRDPWDTDLTAIKTADGKVRAWVDGQGIMEVEDTHLPDSDRDGPSYDRAAGDEGR